MHSHFVIAVRQSPEGKCIIEVLGIGRVNSESQDIPEILSVFQVGLFYLFGNLVRGILHLRLETVREVEFRKNCVHLGIVVPRLSEHIDYVATRTVVSPVPAVHQGRNLEALLRSHLFRLSRIHFYVIRHIAALHQHPGTGSNHMEYAHKRLGGALYDIYYFAFPAGRPFTAGLGASFACYGHTHGIPVQGSPGLGSADKNIFLLAFDDDEGKSLTGHLHLAYELGEHFPALPAPALLGLLPLLLFSNFCFHFDFAKIRNRVIFVKYRKYRI